MTFHNRALLTGLIVLSAVRLAAPCENRAADAQASAPIKLPLRQVHGTYLLIPIVVNGVSHPFLLDTAGGGLSITPATRDLLGYNEHDGMRVQGYGATGKRITQVLRLSSVFMLGRMPLGGNIPVLDLRGVDAGAGEKVAGIIGNGVLRQFDLRIDVARKKFTLSPKAAGKPKEEGDSGLIPFHTTDIGLIEFTVMIDDKPVTAVLDTGAAYTVMNWKAANAAGITMQTSGIRRSPRGISGFDGNVVTAYVYPFSEMKLGEIRYTSPELTIADLPAFETLKIADRPAMLLGLSTLKDGTLAISYGAEQFSLSFSDSGKAEPNIPKTGRQ